MGMHWNYRKQRFTHLATVGLIDKKALLLTVDKIEIVKLSYLMFLLEIQEKSTSINDVY